MTKVQIQKKALIPVIRQNRLDNPDLTIIIFKFILDENEINSKINAESESQSIDTIRLFVKDLRNNLKACGRNYEKLLTKKKKWLDTNMTLNLNYEIHDHTPRPGPGRPSVSFAESSDRSKRRKVSELSKLDSKLLAASASKSSSDPCFSYILKESIRSPSRPSKIKKMITSKPLTKCNTEETLAQLISCNMSYKDYSSWKKFLKCHGSDILPSHQELSLTKKMCCPDNITITETLAECDLKELLKHTGSRLLIVGKEALEEIVKCQPATDDLLLQGTLHCKWGFDGASSQKIYKQIYEEADFSEAIKHEESLFSTCLVPMQLEVNSETIWKNRSPSSILFCRPIRLQFKTETAVTCQQEKDYIESKIEEIEHTTHSIALDNFEFKIILKYDLQLTMLDGKAINAISNNPSTQTCNLCLSKPSQMNDIDSLLKRPVVNVETVKYGLSVLHCWIRFFEFILHLGYKLDIKKWMARTDEEKRSVEKRKKRN